VESGAKTSQTCRSEVLPGRNDLPDAKPPRVAICGLVNSAWADGWILLTTQIPFACISSRTYCSLGKSVQNLLNTKAAILLEMATFALAPGPRLERNKSLWL
jgi:hypothetical protein